MPKLLNRAIHPANLLVTYLKTGKVDAATGEVSTHITDGDGLYIEIDLATRSGTWKCQYRNPVTGKRSRMRLGACKLVDDEVTEMGVAQARLAHKVVLDDLGAKLDPYAEQQKREQAKDEKHTDKVDLARENAARAKAGRPLVNSFREVAELWNEDTRANYVPRYVSGRMSALALHAYPHFGDKHINEITEEDIYAMSKPMIAREIRPTLAMVRYQLKLIFEWAMAPQRKLRERAKGCPVYDDPQVTADYMPETENHPTLLAPELIRTFMLKLGEERPTSSTRALQIAMLTAQRSFTVCSMERAELKLDGPVPVWTIPAIKMKGRQTKKRKSTAKPHRVYLSSQAVALLREQLAAAEAKCPGGAFVFPGNGNQRTSHINPKALRDRIAALGYKDQQSVHGFRPMLRSCGPVYAKCDAIVIEHILAHAAATRNMEEHQSNTERSVRQQAALGAAHGTAYNRTHLLLEASVARRSMITMQRWADWLQRLVSVDWTLDWEQEASNDPFLALLQAA